MALPIHPVSYPAGLRPSMNGRLGPCDLVTMFCAGVGHVSVHPQAKRAFVALFAAALGATGRTLTVVSQGDHYRSLEAQESLFRSRYSVGGTAGGCRAWDSNGDGRPEHWCKHLVDGKVPATAAIPGTSNHGLGLALDVGVWDAEAKRVRFIGTYSDLWQWLSAPRAVDPNWSIGRGTNVESFGLSWEIQSEWWHLRYWAGDKPTRRVIDTEAWIAAEGG